MNWKLFSSIAAVIGLSLSSAAAPAAWINLGGAASTVYPVTVTSHWDGTAHRLNAYVINTDTSISVAQINASTGEFTGWANLGGSLVSSAAAVAWSTHREFFVLGTDFALYHQWSDDNSNWSGWNALGHPPSGNLCSAPSAVSWSAGRIDVFAMGCDRVLWHIWTNAGGGGSWAGWDNLGGTIDSMPSAVSSGIGRLDVFVNDLHGKILDRSFNAGWTWLDTGMTGSFPPSAAVVLYDGAPVVYTRAKSGNTLTAVALDDGVWTSPAGTAPIANLVGGAHAVQSVELPEPVITERVYYQDAQGHIFRQSCQEGGHSCSLDPDDFSSDVFAGAPSPVHGSDDPDYVFAVKSDHALWYAKLASLF